MTYQQLVESALTELQQAGERIADENARRQVFRQIAARQQLDTIEIALNTNTHN